MLESLTDDAKVTKNVDVLTEYCRHSIGETISNLYKDGNGIIHAAVIGDKLESIITESLQNQKEMTQNLGLYPSTLRKLNDILTKVMAKFNSLGFTPIIVTSATIRPYFYRLINSSFPDLAVLSFSELPANVELEFIDKVEVSNEN